MVEPAPGSPSSAALARQQVTLHLAQGAAARSCQRQWGCLQRVVSGIDCDAQCMLCCHEPCSPTAPSTLGAGWPTIRSMAFSQPSPTTAANDCHTLAGCRTRHLRSTAGCTCTSRQICSCLAQACCIVRPWRSAAGCVPAVGFSRIVRFSLCVKL